MKRRILSVLLAAVMLFGSLGITAFASYNKKYDINGDGFVNPRTLFACWKSTLTILRQ